jgi:PTS system nitrogen regulatory IIA component
MYLNIVQLAESLGVEENVVEGWIAKDGLPCVRDGGRLMFDRTQVATWAAQHGLGANAGFLAPAQRAAAQGARLSELLRAGGISRHVPAAEVLDRIERMVSGLPGTTPAIAQLLSQRVRAPGGITWAPVGHGLALPHLRAHVALGRDAGLIAILLLDAPLSLENPPEDRVPVTRLVFFIAPSPRAHLEILARLSAALTRGGLRELLQKAAPDDQVYAALDAFDEASQGTEAACP